MLLRGGSNSYSIPCSYTTLSPNIISDRSDILDINYNQTIIRENNIKGNIADILVPSVIYIAIRSIYIIYILLRW
jgi:hypothetical protein